MAARTELFSTMGQEYTDNTGTHYEVEMWLTYDDATLRTTGLRIVNNSNWPASGQVQDNRGNWSAPFTFPAHSTTTFNITNNRYPVTVDAQGNIIDQPNTIFSWPA